MKKVKNKVYDIADLNIEELADRGASLLTKSDNLVEWIDRKSGNVPDKMLDKYRMLVIDMIESAERCRALTGSKVYTKFPELRGYDLKFSNNFKEVSAIPCDNIEERREEITPELTEAMNKVLDDDANDVEKVEILEALKSQLQSKKASA